MAAKTLVSSTVLALAMATLFAGPSSAQGWKARNDAKKEAKQQKKNAQKKENIDKIARETMERLFKDNPDSKELYDLAYGAAVFDMRQTKLVLSGGGGSGVALERESGKRTYMKTASLGVGIGLGIQFYQVVFIFETAEVMHYFVEEGWEVSSGANAVAGEEGQNLHATATDTDKIAAGANASAGYADGIAVFQFTEKGYMLQADISGTKYWKDKGLNAL